VGLSAGAAASLSGSVTLFRVATALEPVGTLWTNAIRMTVLPLVVALLVTGVAATTDPKRLGRIGARAVPVFLGLLLAGGAFALALAPVSLDGLRIPPEVARALRASAAASTTAVEGARQMPSLIQRMLDIVPANPLKAATDGAMLPVIVFTLAFAVALVRLETERREPVVRVFRSIGDAMLVVVGWVLAFAPVGIFALALSLGARLGVAAAGALLHYVLTLSAVLLAFTLLLYPVAWALGGVPLRRFAAAAVPAQAVAFSSRSSLAALPALIAGAHDRLQSPPAVTGFALPLAVSVFRLNVPIAWVVGALFLGKLYGVALDLPQLGGLVLTATLISFSVPGIPSSSLFLLAPVLVELGLPAEGAGILIAVDAIPDMFKTTVNVTSHLATAAIVGRSEGAAPP
jgi:proton glutamate symport protein